MSVLLAQLPEQANFREGDIVQVRSGGRPMRFSRYAKSGEAVCELHGKIYVLPAAILRQLDQRPPRRGRKPGFSPMKRHDPLGQVSAAQAHLQTLNPGLATRMDAMTPDESARLVELDRRIDKIRAEMRDLSDRAAATSGNASEERLSAMLDQHESTLQELLRARQALAYEASADNG